MMFQNVITFLPAFVGIQRRKGSSYGSLIIQIKVESRTDPQLSSTNWPRVGSSPQIHAASILSLPTASRLGWKRGEAIEGGA